MRDLRALAGKETSNVPPGSSLNLVLYTTYSVYTIKVKPEHTYDPFSESIEFPTSPRCFFVLIIVSNTRSCDLGKSKPPSTMAIVFVPVLPHPLLVREK